MTTKSNLVSEKVSGVDVKSSYSLEFLDKLNNIKNISKEIEFSYGESMACFINVSNEFLTLNYILAPMC